MKEIPHYQRSTATKIEFKDDKKFQKAIGVSWNPGSETLHFKFDAHEPKVDLKENSSVAWIKFTVLWD